MKNFHVLDFFFLMHFLSTCDWIQMLSLIFSSSSHKRDDNKSF